MNIKSLLLGSAAALVAVSGAQAADVVIAAEPEPVDYVRVCDVYGAGFFYIPGTETCLKISGYVRYDIGIGDREGLRDTTDKWDLARGIVDTNDTYRQRARGLLDIDARKDTEYGTLRGFIELRFNYDMGDTDADGLSDTYYGWDLNHAYIELGGLRLGKTDSLFTTWTNYAGAVNDDTLIPYGPFGTHQISYTFKSGAFSAAVALENGNGETYTIDSYMPDVVGALAYDGGQWKIAGVAGYDSVWEEFALKARLDVKATDTISAFLMAGWQSDEDKPNFYAPWLGDWAVWGGVSAKLNDKATFNAQLSYDSGIRDALGDRHGMFGAAVNVQYTIAPGFYVRPEIDYINVQDADDIIGGKIRFQYSFGS